MEYYQILLPLAMILLLSKLFSIGGKKIGLPQVVGMLMAGIVIGLIKYIPGQNVLTPTAMEGLEFLAKIGVILIMFSAGIGTDLKQFKSAGGPSVVITILGVVVPLGLGFVVAAPFNGGFANMTADMALSNLFYGAILSATSVSVTVAALKELGKLNTKVGTSIVAAAILDDILGIILLSVLIGIRNSGGFSSDIWIVLLKNFGFFVVAIALGFPIHFLFKWMDKKWPKNRRVPIFSFALCFFFAYAAEHWFNIADITGAYMAGIVLASVNSSRYIDSKIETSSYMIFAPVFFAQIGISTSFEGINGAIVGFGFAYVAIGLISKVIGCGLGAKLCRYSWKDSFTVGIGMVARAEVLLVCAQKGIDNGMVHEEIMPFVLILIIVSSLITPVILKLLYKKDGTSLPPLDGGTDYFTDVEHGETIPEMPNVETTPSSIGDALG